MTPGYPHSDYTVSPGCYPGIPTVTPNLLRDPLGEPSWNPQAAFATRPVRDGVGMRDVVPAALALEVVIFKAAWTKSCCVCGALLPTDQPNNVCARQDDAHTRARLSPWTGSDG